MPVTHSIHWIDNHFCISYLCPSIETFAKSLSRLFIVVETKITLKERPAQVVPVSMVINGIGITALINMLIDILLNEYSGNVNVMVYADDFSAAWNSQDLRRCWSVLIEIGPKFGYCPELKQTWLIIKSSVSEKVESVFFGTKIKDNNRRFLISWRISWYTQV